MARLKTYQDDLGKLLAPPQNLDAEKAILGAILLNTDAAVLNETLEHLHSEDFYVEAHRSIFQAIRDTAQANVAVDAISVSDRLDKNGKLEESGGMLYLGDLTSNAPSVAVSDHYRKIVKEKSQLRSLLHASVKIQKSIYETGEIDTALSVAESAVNQVAESRVAANDTSIKEIMVSVMEDFEQRKLGYNESKGHAIPYEDLGGRLGGLRNGEMIVLAARPSMGKTTFALNLIHDLGVNQQIPTLFFSLEMDQKRIVNNMVCLDSEIDSATWMNHTRNLDTRDHEKLMDSFARLESAPIFIDDEPSLTPTTLMAKLRRYKKENDLQACFIDYLQLMSSPEYTREGRTAEISHISRSIKAIARDLKIPIIALAQLNRAVEQRSEKRPVMSDLKESGSIEQDADAVLLLHRPDYYDPNDRPGQTDVILAKNRNGPTGISSLYYAREKCLFSNLEHE